MSSFLPELALVVFAFLVVGLDLVAPGMKRRAETSALLSLTGVIAALLLSFWSREGHPFGGLFSVDSYAIFFRVFLLGLGLFVVAASADFVNRHLLHPGEYYGILLLSLVGAMLMAAADEFLTAYISLELLSFSLYVLVTLSPRDARSPEAGTKYILLGALSSALLLYGISLVYGTLGTTRFPEIAARLQGEVPTAFYGGLVLVLAGLGFKVAAVPFHMWAPDVYEGAPLPVTAYLSVVSKAASFALLVRLFTGAFAPTLGQWQLPLAVLAAVTMTVGNLVAIPQRNIKRMLAYSTIGQTGYLLLGLVAFSPRALQGLLLHLVGYGVTNLAAFTVIIAYFNLSQKEDIPDYAGLGHREPWLAFSLSVALFSLAGLPFFAGFTTKFYLFTAAAEEGFLWLVALAMLNSLISLYYYLMVLKQMYIVPAQARDPLKTPPLLVAAIALLLIGVIAIGVYPSPLVQAVEQAVAVF